MFATQRKGQRPRTPASPRTIYRNSGGLFFTLLLGHRDLDLHGNFLVQLDRHG